MPLQCPQCRASIAAEDVNIQALVGMCRACREVFRIDGQLPPAAMLAAPAPRQPQPASVVIHEEGDEHRLQWRWFRPMLFFLLFFCIAWDSFLVFWYAMALGGIMGGGAGGGFELLAFIFPVCHVAIGVGLTYYVVAGFLNSTTLLVTDELFRVQHRPLPWLGNHVLPRSVLREFYIELGATTRTNGANMRQYYNVACVADDGKKRKVLGALELSEAQFCVQQLNQWCGLAPSRLGVSLTATM